MLICLTPHSQLMQLTFPISPCTPPPGQHLLSLVRWVKQAAAEAATAFDKDAHVAYSQKCVVVDFVLDWEHGCDRTSEC